MSRSGGKAAVPATQPTTIDPRDLVKGLDTRYREPSEKLRESWLIMQGGTGDGPASADGKAGRAKVCAQILRQKSGELRANFKAMPGTAALRKKAGIQPTKSQGEWAAFAKVTPANADAVRELLSLGCGAAA